MDLEKFLDKILGELEISKELQKINKDDLLVSYDFNRLYSSAQIDINSTWPKIEIAYPLKKGLKESICSFFNSGRWNKVNRSAFLTVNYHNPKKLVFQRLPMKEKIKNPYKNNRFEEIKRMRNGILIDKLTCVGFVEIVECGGVILEVYESFFSQNLDYNPYTEVVTDLFEKRDLFKSHAKKYFKTQLKRSDYQSTVAILEKIKTRNTNALLRFG